jgi:hypothetical protein
MESAPASISRMGAGMLGAREMPRPWDHKRKRVNAAVLVALVGAIVVFLRLMVLIPWDAICHPLRESTIDYERGVVRSRPAQNA